MPRYEWKDRHGNIVEVMRNYQDSDMQPNVDVDYDNDPDLEPREWTRMVSRNTALSQAPGYRRGGKGVGHFNAKTSRDERKG